MIYSVTFLCAFAVNCHILFVSQCSAAKQLGNDNVSVENHSIFYVFIRHIESHTELKRYLFWLEMRCPDLVDRVSHLPPKVPCEVYIPNTERCESDDLVYLASLSFLKKLPFLQRVHIAGGRPSKKLFETLSMCPLLQSLAMDCPLAGSSNTSNLRVLRNLRYLHELEFDALSNHTLEGIDNLPALTALRIDNVTVNTSNLQVLKSLRQLEQLALLRGKRTSVIDSIDLSGWDHLTSLAIDSLRLSPDEWNKIAELRLLYWLNIYNEDIECRDLRALQNSNVRSLSMTNCRIEDGMVGFLLNFSGLTHLTIDTSTVSDADLLGLRRLPHLESLSLSNCKLSDSLLYDMKFPPSVRSVWFKGAASKDAANALRRLNPHATIYFSETGSPEANGK